MLTIAKNKLKVKLSAPSLWRQLFKAAAVRGYAESLDSSDLDSPDEFGFNQDEDDHPDHHVFPVIGQPPIGGVAQLPWSEGINVDDISRIRKAVTLYRPQSHFTKKF